MPTISSAYHLTTRKNPEQWYHQIYQIYLLNDFEHRHYNRFVSERDQQLPLG